MRLLIDSLIALMLVGILGAVLVHHRHEQQRIEQHRQVHEALSLLYEQTLYHAAVDPEFGRITDPQVLSRPLHRFPSTVDPRWFRGSEPRNALGGPRPWLDVAPVSDGQDHPPDPILRRPDQAGFWYNPTRGLFRARVPMQITEEATLDLYNRLNNTSLARLEEARDAARQPTVPLEMQIATLRKGTVASAPRSATDARADGEAASAAEPTPTRRPALVRTAEVAPPRP